MQNVFVIIADCILRWCICICVLLSADAAKSVSGPRTRSRDFSVEDTTLPEKDAADDKDFTVTEEMEQGEGGDDEDTMEQEENEEGTVDHDKELADLKEEGVLLMYS